MRIFTRDLPNGAIQLLSIQWVQIFSNFFWWTSVKILSFKLGDPIKSDLDLKTAKNIARIALPLRNLTNSCVRAIDPEDELFILRVKSRKNEIFISYDEKFTLILMQSVPSKT